jgi:hypothetical protein
VVETPEGGFMRMEDLSGVADIVGVLPGGRFLAVECKVARGRLSPAQREFQAAVERMGGLYVTARSIDDLRREGL